MDCWSDVPERQELVGPSVQLEGLISYWGPDDSSVVTGGKAEY